MSQSVGRALQILLSLRDGPRSLDELATILDVHKSTVLRLVQTLEADRFVRHDDRHDYSLGSRLLELGDVSLQQHAISDAAAGPIADLGRASGGQTVHVATWEGDHAVYIAKQDSTHPVRMYSRVGLTAPLHATAVGKVLLAGLDPAALDSLVNRLELTRFTESTIVDRMALMTEVGLVREQGWATDDREHEEHVTCIAAPIRSPEGRVAAAVSVSVPAVPGAPSVDDLLDDVLVAANQIASDWTGA